MIRSPSDRRPHPVPVLRSSAPAGQVGMRGLLQAPALPGAVVGKATQRDVIFGNVVRLRAALDWVGAPEGQQLDADQALARPPTAEE
jgi:hypothetical protein